MRGIVEEVFPEGVNIGKYQRRTQILLVAKLGELRHKVSSCVYQDKTVTEIVAALTKPWHIDLDVRPHPEPKKREYCCQVNETDLAFLMRILAEDGIHFHVHHEKDKSTLVLVNDPLGYKPIVGTPSSPSATPAAPSPSITSRPSSASAASAPAPTATSTFSSPRWWRPLPATSRTWSKRRTKPTQRSPHRVGTRR